MTSHAHSGHTLIDAANTACRFECAVDRSNVLPVANWLPRDRSTEMEMREFYEERGKAFNHRYYEQLEGATILRFEGMLGDDNDQFPTFRVRLSNGQIVQIEVSRDPEGNGGGFLFGLLYPDMSDFTARAAELAKEEADA